MVRGPLGHIRLGQLPRVRRWADVLAALGAGGANEAGAADTRLARLGSDPGIAYLYWLLTRLTWHARSADNLGALRADGVDLGPQFDGLMFLGKLRQVAERGLHLDGEKPPDSPGGPASPVVSVVKRAFPNRLLPPPELVPNARDSVVRRSGLGQRRNNAK